MSSGDGAVRRPVRRALRARPRLRSLFEGGTDGNERLTTAASVALLVLLAAIGVTILPIHQLITFHLFVGLALIGPVILKLGSAGYRFARYYVRNQAYRDKGPPGTALRVLAPFVVGSTMVVFLSGIVLLFTGPVARGPWLSIHKVSFIVWIGVTAPHVLAHLPGLAGSLRAGSSPGEPPVSTPGARGRSLALIGALVGGAVLAVVLIPEFGSWLSYRHHG